MWLRYKTIREINFFNRNEVGSFCDQKDGNNYERYNKKKGMPIVYKYIKNVNFMPFWKYNFVFPFFFFFLYILFLKW